ncbi:MULTISPECIES: hypothetical protein [Brenneria]|uniref:Uncharacterized protein n=1 Tax=Brenneria nigrifluens DSM 30175 = ATCC 13028 TaxID=1121120 RepID=A0ABX5V5T3_9GAMM|nr:MULTISPECIES: hypothetical protein [Brenneria]EHD22625.1 hypothetical protein BrE312_3260 [Brenneria sp. EniD312]QCR05610.1 hypothetical protein EH206_16325 [Brenneria nigrifluens DSM 30175 = ATCC 13028]
MKPSTLKAGMRVLLHPSLGLPGAFRATVIRRTPRTYGRHALTVVRVDEFAGLNGPGDNGDVHLSDYEVSRLLHPLEASA